MAVVSKMRSNPFYLGLCLLFAVLCLCNGAPPKNVPYNRYSDQEDDLMFKMLQSQKETGSYQPAVWKRIEKAFEERRKAKINGFSKERSTRSIKQHFLNTLRNDKIKVPDALRELYEEFKRMSFTRQEQDFINRELLQSDDSSCLYSVKRWSDIQNKHEKKYKSGELGFPNKRSRCVLLNHFRTVMKPKNLVLDAVKRKFRQHFETEQDLTPLEELLNELDGPSEKFHHYSEQERDLMFEMLVSQAGSYKPSVWKEIQKAFEEKIKAESPGFYKHRSLRSLQRNFVSILKSDKIQVPDAVRKIRKEMERNIITPQERDLINTELSRSDLPTSWSLAANDRWKKIEEKHDEKRKSGTRGFANKRPYRVLRHHFYCVMKSKNLIDEAVKRRFPQDFRTDQGKQNSVIRADATTSEEGEESDPGESMECDGESEVWDPILEDLEHSQRGPVK